MLGLIVGFKKSMNVIPLVFKQKPSFCRLVTRMASIFVYNGEGSKEESSNSLLQELKDTVDLNCHDVQFISAAQIMKGFWMSKAKAICFGGGYDLGFIKSLERSGIEKIREFVEEGGSYLGICAGGYFACDYIEFDKGGHLEVVGERSLKFFDGKCIGPAFPGFDYNSRKGVHAVPVVYCDCLSFETYMEGGGYFMPYESSSPTNVEVLAWYEQLEPRSEAAVVKCKYGKGSAVLSGVHLEFSVQRLDFNDKYLKQTLPQFLFAEEKRKIVFRDLLSHLGIACHSTTNHNNLSL